MRTAVMSAVIMTVFSTMACSKYMKRSGTTAVVPTAPPSGRETADRRPPSAPQPPAPPPIPGEPIVKPPQPEALAAGIPQLPNSAVVLPAGGEATVPTSVPTSPILATGAIALPDDATAGVNLPQPKPPVVPPKAAPAPAVAPPAGGVDLAAVRKLADESRKRYADLAEFECRLVKREVVGGKALPQDEIVYRFRQEPLSVYMKVLSEAGKGRELMYVKGKFDGKIHVLTGKGDNVLVGAGFKTDMEPDSKTATAKSRYRIYEAGFGRTLAGLTKALNPADHSAPAVKPLGLVTRKEYPYALEAVEVTIAAGTDPLLPKGGKRQIHFDSKPDSPSYLMPVLVVTESDGKEVEYYSFDKFKTPSGWRDADWTPASLGKK